MRKFKGMHTPVNADPRAVRKELLEVNRWIKQAEHGFKNMTKTNYPVAIISAGSGAPGDMGNLPQHNHSQPAQGGAVLGTTTSHINGYGFWDFNNGLGVGAYQTTLLNLNIAKTFDAPAGDFKGLNLVTTVTNAGNPTSTVAPHLIKLDYTMTNNSSPPNEVRGLFVNMRLNNTTGDGAGLLWTNTSYLTDIHHNQDMHQIVGNRVTVQATLANGAGNLDKFEAYVMDNSWKLDTGKTITDFIIFSAPTPKVTNGNGITNFYTIRQDPLSGVIGTSYILKADAPVGTITTKWGIWIDGSTVKNFLGGKLGINQGAPSAAMLEAVSDNAATKVVQAVGASAQSADWVSLVNNAGNSVGLKVPNSGLTTHSYVLPSAQGASGYALTNDGSGNLSWAAAAPANRSRSIFLKPIDFQQLNGFVAPTSATTTSATPNGFQTFVLVDAPISGPQSFTTQLSVPLDYVAGTAIEVWLHWTETVANLSDLAWVFRYHYTVRGNKEAIDGGWTTTSDTLVDNGLTGTGGDYDVGVAYYHAVTRIATDIPSTGITTAKTMFLTIDRLSTDAADTLNRNIGFIGLELRYTAIL